MITITASRLEAFLVLQPEQSPTPQIGPSQCLDSEDDHMHMHDYPSQSDLLFSGILIHVVNSGILHLANEFIQPSTRLK